MSIHAVKAERPEAPSAPSLRLAAGTYLTDELNLFRCVSVAPASERGATVLLENCLTLEHIVFPLEQLDPKKLRVVSPAMGGTGLEPVTSCL